MSVPLLASDLQAAAGVELRRYIMDGRWLLPSRVIGFSPPTTVSTRPRPAAAAAAAAVRRLRRHGRRSSDSARR